MGNIIIYSEVNLNHTHSVLIRKYSYFTEWWEILHNKSRTLLIIPGKYGVAFNSNFRSLNNLLSLKYLHTYVFEYKSKGSNHLRYCIPLSVGRAQGWNS